MGPKIVIPALLIATFTTFSPSASGAMDNMVETYRYVRLLEQTKVSLVEATKVAEKHTGGQAVASQLRVENRVAIFEITVVARDRLFKVIVSVDGGEILKVTEVMK